MLNNCDEYKSNPETSVSIELKQTNIEVLLINTHNVEEKVLKLVLNEYSLIKELLVSCQTLKYF